ncbi:MAG: autotransporter assembly complex family protein [Pseudomonadota bacterium]
MGPVIGRVRAHVGAVFIVIGLGLTNAQAQDLEISTAFIDEELTESLRAASLVRVVLDEASSTSQDVVAAAKADYKRYLSVLYQNGYYSGVVSILVDGREAAQLSPFETPDQVSKIEVEVTPGNPFTFGRAIVDPTAPGTELPEDFRSGALARSGLIKQAADASIQSWRDVGHAKAALTGQRVTAAHQENALNVDIKIDPGPRLTFGEMKITGNTDVRTERIRAMAGFPAGAQFSDEDLETTQRRISRTGAFRFVVVEEAETPNSDDTIDVIVELQEEKPRRLGFGAEIGSSDGISVSGFWFHRNLLGGGERLRFDADLTQQLEDGEELEFTFGVSFLRPAVFAPEADYFASLDISREANSAFREDIATFDTGFNYRFSDEFFVYGGIRLSATKTDLKPGKRRFRIFGTPVGATYDTRDIVTDARAGTFITGEVFPFVGERDADDGVRTTLDARYYKSFIEDDALTLAVRGQLGSVFGATSGSVPESYLFFSGGGGTVRGQPFESLGVTRNGSLSSGEGFAGLSLEARYRFTDAIGAVGFFDYGRITDGDIFNGTGDSHSGAGLGLRYDTPVGPIRVDIAAPVSGDTDDGVQFYFGLGQAF